MGSIHDMAPSPMGRVPKVTRVCGVDMGKMLNYNKVKTTVDMHCFHTHTHTQVTTHSTHDTHKQNYTCTYCDFHAQSKHAQRSTRNIRARQDCMTRARTARSAPDNP